ncbi:MAG: TerB family tellurite resistance protein [Mariprofundaceae bacterium]
MFKSLKQPFSTSKTKGSQNNQAQLSLALTVLMVHVMQQDDQIHPNEESEILQAIQKRFDLPESTAKKVIEKAIIEAQTASDLHQFTFPLIKAFSQKERIEIIAQLWRVAMADGHIDPHEEAIIRKTAELIGVHHHQFIDAKISARES